MKTPRVQWYMVEEVMVALFRAGYPLDEIASRLGVSKGAVRNRMTRMREKDPTIPRRASGGRPRRRKAL